MTAVRSNFDADEWLDRTFRKDQAEALREREAEAERRSAADLGLWAVADAHIPPDVREAAERWKLDAVLLEIWRAAFIDGWRAGLKTQEKKGVPSP